MNSTKFYDVFFRGTTKLDRDVLFLRFYESFTMREIAGILGISISRSRKHCRRGVSMVIKNLLDAAPVKDSSLDEDITLNAAPAKANLSVPDVGEESSDIEPVVLRLDDSPWLKFANTAGNANPAYDGPACHALTG